MRLAIIGAGNVGGTLGTAWAQKAGHEIFFGVRNPTSEQTQAVARRLDGRGRRADDAVECGRSDNPLDGRFERKDYPRCNKPARHGA